MNERKMAEAGLAACKKAHEALWEGLDNTLEGKSHFLTRFNKLLASELMTMTHGHGKAANELLQEVVIPMTEEMIAELSAMPEVWALNIIFGRR